ncbi:MAG: 5-(carboxyamino)imidazole ribonucleotide synthase, partial [Aquiluna sp.]|nr:5-(carboxyamino)imidazole ribonucleotide synthase [Aquiluna sp.]
PKSLIFAQNKALMRRRLAELGLPLPAWQTASDAAAIEAFIAIHGPEIIVKTPVGGYDGKGVRVVSDSQQVSDWLDQIEKLGGELLLEEKVPFVRELAQLVARNPSGDLATYEVVQTVQKNGVCAEVIAPAPKPADSIAARKIAEEIAVGLNVVGMMAVELFETADGHLVINELAMRPHNSGHYSIEGTATSQFEQHLRAVLDLPLGSTELLAPAAVMVNLLGVDDRNTFTEHYNKAMRVDAALKFHSYEKSARGGRKMGHITALGDHPAELLKKAHSAAAAIYNQI